MKVSSVLNKPGLPLREYGFLKAGAAFRGLDLVVNTG
jgi:hypothetical protein